MVLTGTPRAMRIDAVAADPGRIGMAPCPGIGKWYSPAGEGDLDDDLRAIKDWGACALVSLMEKEEMALFGVDGLPGKSAGIGMEHYHLPIPDMDVPAADFHGRWQDAGAKLRTHLLSGRSIVLHCLAGLGRTGTVAGRLLVELGVDAELAIRRVRTARPGTIQTLMQERYVRSCVPVQGET